MSITKEQANKLLSLVDNLRNKGKRFDWAVENSSSESVSETERALAEAYDAFRLFVSEITE